MNRLAIAFAILALLLAACAGGAGDPTETDADATDTRRPDPETPEMTTPHDGGTNGGVPQQMLDDVIDQASNEIGVPVDEITVVTAEEVTWSDGSIGCPEPGMVYTQALVPGYRVVLDVAGDEINFHAAQDGEFFICDDPKPPASER
jgi:hypothetical protein